MNCQPLSDLGIQESVWCLVTLSGTATLLVGLVYRSLNSTAENNEKILHVIHNLYRLQKFSHLLLIGDFNLPDINWNDYSCPSDLSLSTRFLDTVQDAFLIQHVDTPTRHCMGQCSSILDLIFTNDPAIVCNIVHLSPLGHSDHEGVLTGEKVGLLFMRFTLSDHRSDFLI